MKCNICNEEQTVRSMAMHLQWQHQLKTENYIQQYGEFRPKELAKLEKQTKSQIKCQICNKNLISHQQLIHHISEHHIIWEEYFIKYFFNGQHPKCKCGCGQHVELIRHGKNEKGEIAFCRDYIKGHWDWVKPGYHYHSEETKSKMSESAKKRQEKEKETNGYTNWHSPDSLAKRFSNNWKKTQQRIKKAFNIECLNENDSISIKKTKEYRFKCLTCNHQWTQISFYPNCQKCNPPYYNGISNEEKEIHEFLKLYFNDLLFNQRNIIPNQELDIYIPSLKIAIEYNGLFWHSEAGGKFQDYHINKTRECEKQGIQLIHIFSDEWLNKKDIVKSRLLNIIGKTPNKIYARKCVVKIIDNKISQKFLNNNHIQGEDKSKIKLGLFYNNELVSVMTFGRPRIAIGKNQNNLEYELVRFCNKINTVIIGGASKLFEYFKKHYNPQSIISFADKRWSKGNLYNNLKFIQTNISNPGYWYTKDFTIRLHRYNFNKFNLGKMGYDITNKTEREIMEQAGYYKVWDCGTIRFEWTKTI